MSGIRAFLEACKTRLVAALPPPPAPRGSVPLEYAWSKVLPKVRPQSAHASFAARPGGQRPEARALAGTSLQSLVLDCSTGDLDVTPAHLLAWGQDFERMMNKARTNLLARGGEERFERTRHGFYRSTWADGLDGSRILLPGILRRLRLEGEPVAFLPCKDVLLLAGSEDPRGLCLALEATLEIQDAGDPTMDGCPLQLSGFQWGAFELAEGHPAASLLARVRGRRPQGVSGQPKRPLESPQPRDEQLIALAPLLA